MGLPNCLANTYLENMLQMGLSAEHNFIESIEFLFDNYQSFAYAIHKEFTQVNDPRTWWSPEHHKMSTNTKYIDTFS